MTEVQTKVIGLVLISCKGDKAVTEERIRFLINIFSQLDPLSDDEKEELIPVLHTRLAVKMDRGGCIKEENHKSWFYAAKKGLSMAYWDRYRTYMLGIGYNSDVLDSLDQSTDEMIDMLGNPEASSFQHRGLVIGDVQSGKTGTYTALINKAADAGYRVIILLTGTIEKLRKQTQGRIDKGFVGLDSSALIQNKDNVLVGVGEIDSSIQGFVLTSTTSDFNKSTATKLNCKLASIHDPVMFVLKKNKSVLEKLEQWLKVYNAIDGKISEPMLLIDDEADNASVNTRKEDEDPTAINAAIRRLLALFVKANYVGFTATPFANIFIDPDKTDEQVLKDDLFPRNFIYALEAPDTYVGARGVFGGEDGNGKSSDGKYAYMLHNNDDCESFVPEKHKKGFEPLTVPESLNTALASFFIINTIRDLRGHNKAHRSMLINISRFIDVQDRITNIVNSKVREMQREIRNYSKLGSEAMVYPSFQLLKKTYDQMFSTSKLTWDRIQKNISDSVQSIVVRSVNGGNAAKNLNYDECEDDGLRLIAVGGYSLSRGLTLEGLCVSYFHRNSKMYDTLMQMGRWFGYREGYIDLCQIWMGDEAVAWYRQISIASDELRREVYRMKNANKTPRDFGLRVRSDVNVLLVTAQNKMRSAHDHEVVITLSGEVVETQFLPSESNHAKANALLLDKWLKDIQREGFSFLDRYADQYEIHALQTLSVPKQRIIDLLTSFYSHQLNFSFSPESLIDLIKNSSDGTMDNWDVAIATGEGEPLEYFGGFEGLRPVERIFHIKEASKALQMSKGASHLASKTLAKTGLKRDDADMIEKKYRADHNLSPEKTLSQNAWFSAGIKRNPVLVVYPVELKIDDKDDTTRAKKERLKASLPSPMIGLTVGIPSVDGVASKKYNYKINVVLYRELLEIGDDFEEETSDLV